MKTCMISLCLLNGNVDGLNCNVTNKNQRPVLHFHGNMVFQYFSCCFFPSSERGEEEV